MWDLPDDPRTEESALCWARAHVPAPHLLRRHRHVAYDADETSGGFAFTTPDRLVLVGRHKSVSLQVLAPEDDVDAIIDAWLRDERHRNRELDDADLGPCQRAALDLVAAEVEPGDVRARLARELDSAADVDTATYLWIELRRALARGVEPRRALAADDDLLAATRVPAALMITACPLCRDPVATLERYPRAVCDDCHARTTCVHGRLVRGFNTSFGGGFAAEHEDGEEPVACDETTHSGECTIDDAPCRIGEARFGGVVVEAG